VGGSARVGRGSMQGGGGSREGSMGGGRKLLPVIIFILLKQLQFYCLYFNRMFSAIS
jgi:hypothetical protein